MVGEPKGLSWRKGALREMASILPGLNRTGRMGMGRMAFHRPQHWAKIAVQASVDRGHVSG